jgi:ABC-type lipoprotein export system ATPase subunit
MTEPAPILRLSGIAKSYGEVTALRPTDLALFPGELLALHGPSGSGKSTLLQIAGALLAPDSGEVVLASQTPYSLTPDQRSQFRLAELGFVFQEGNLLPFLTLVENIQVPYLGGGIVEPGRAEDLLAHFGLGHRSGHRPSELSAGERQRAALARALLMKPKLLLADEPTGNLDPENTERVLGYLEEYAAAGNAVIIATHEERAIARANRRHPLA